ncbi:UNVERIFIED_CONTAM: hypothetical protein Slati_1700300 [Sesamum latifolium]|uniref:Uncharacterized protein n=1 Tax=Sesamum latifolium TaxID=2727402 RepID=A0AAW2WXR6_9LAMI
MAAAFCHLIDAEEEEVGGNEGEASSPSEEGRAARDLVAVHPSSSMDWGSSTLQTSHITQMRRDFFIPSSQIIYTPGPKVVLLSPPPTVCLFSLPKCEHV